VRRERRRKLGKRIDNPVQDLMGAVQPSCKPRHTTWGYDASENDGRINNLPQDAILLA
jgi:hypothetical protein